MTHFIAVESIRDHKLSAALMADLPNLIQAENLLMYTPYTQYALFEDGVVTECVMVIEENEVASIPYFHHALLGDIEALVRHYHKGVRYVNVYASHIGDLGNGWEVVAANFKTRIAAKTKHYTLADTEHPQVKVCHTDMGSVVATVLENVMCVAMSTEPFTVETQKAIDAAAGVAASEDKPFTVQAYSTVWQNAFMENPNYVFTNCTVSKDLRA